MTTPHSRCANRFLKQDKGNLFAICNLALFYTKKGEAKRAESFIQSLRQVYPLDGDHYVKVAETLCAVGEYRLSYERLKEVNRFELELRPALLFCIGVSLVHLGEQEKAKSYIVKCC